MNFLLGLQLHNISSIGCNTRAHIFAQKITTALRQRFKNTGKVFEWPKKHFVFGNLRFKTKHAEQHSGIVQWVYHVAPIVKLWDLKHDYYDLFILDPGVWTIPILRDDWLKLIAENPSKDISGYVTCEPEAYSQSSTYCFDPIDELADIEEMAEQDNEMYLAM